MHHVMAKYLPSESKAGLQKAEAAFRQALDLNPDLAIAHKPYAQLEVDLGRAADAIHRLLPRAQGAADPEIFAGLVSPLRYCGLLEASVAAHRRAIALEPKIRTSVAHTWFLQRDYERLGKLRVEDFPYIVGIAFAELGRRAEAITGLRAVEEKLKTRIADFARAARTMIEGDTPGSAAAADRIVTSDFSDPEGLFYLARHLAHLSLIEEAMSLLERVVSGGFFCYPAIRHDPWLDPLRPLTRFEEVLRKVENKHETAAKDFAAMDGHRILRLDRQSEPTHPEPVSEAI